MKVVRFVVKILSYLLIAVFAVITIYNVVSFFKRQSGEQVPLIFGVGMAVIITGSMSPTIEVNDLVVIYAQDEYEVDDIVTYEGATKSVTHRIIGKRVDESTGEIYYETKGDNPINASDGEIHESKIIGKVVLTVPKFGYVQEFIQKPMGMLTVFIGGGILIILTEFLTREQNNEEEEE
ncbi:MAG: signal peptidase I [Clostridia bacterium]|nr:signal peptidase I [Clostridia bacterium]